MELKPVRTNKQDFRGNYAPAQDVAYASAEGRKVLRNTYMLLALTMVPTVIGAWIGMQTAGVIMASPIISTVVLLAAVIGLQFAIAANRNSSIGVGLLLLMTGILGWWLGPILNVALSMSNGMALVGYAAVGTGAVFLTMGAIARSGIQTYRLRQDGATYAVEDSTAFLSSALPTDVGFGPDGRLYYSDWAEGWPKSKRGRIYAIFHPEHLKNPLVHETQRFLAEGMQERDLEGLDLSAWRVAGCGAEQDPFTLPDDQAEQYATAYLLRVEPAPDGDDLAEGAGEYVVIANNADIRVDNVATLPADLRQQFGFDSGIAGVGIAEIWPNPPSGLGDLRPIIEEYADVAVINPDTRSDFSSFSAAVVERMSLFEDRFIVVGGVIPPADVPALLKAGAAAVYPPGTVIATGASPCKSASSSRPSASPGICGG